MRKHSYAGCQYLGDRDLFLCPDPCPFDSLKEG